MNFYLDFIVLCYIQIPIINHFTSCLSDGQRHCYQTLRLAKIILSFQEANISENMIHRTQVTMQTIFHFVIHTHSTSFCKTNKLIIKKNISFQRCGCYIIQPKRPPKWRRNISFILQQSARYNQSISNKPKNERGSLRSQATALHRDNTKTVKVDRDHELFSQGNYFFSKSQQVRDFF